MSEARPPAPPLRRAELDPDPIAQFGRWLADAEAVVPMAEAMCLATADPEGHPDARMVLLKGFGSGGFRFFTNERSAKGLQLASHPSAALVFDWRALERQVRIRGAVERVPAADADAYFASRPRDSQLGAWASPQSEPLHDRAELERLVAEADERFSGADVPRPEHWGGYAVVPSTIELWQGRPGRIHDRFRYTRKPEGWRLERLAP